MAKKTETKENNPGFAIPKENYRYLIIGLVIIVLGFMLMIGGKSPDPLQFNAEEIFSFRRITIAPVMVLIGFTIEIWAIMRKPADTPRD